MRPQLDEVALLRQRTRAGLAYALEHFANISQVINIMALLGDGEKVLAVLNAVKELDGGLDQLIAQGRDLFYTGAILQLEKEPVQNVGEDAE